MYDRSRIHPDRNNFAPRFGLAYRLSDSMVFRGGYGVSYIHFNRYGGDSMLAYNWPFELTTKFAQTAAEPICTSDASPAGCFRSPMMGFPDGMLSTTLSGLSTQSYVYYQPSDLRTAYVQNWHVTLQRTLPKNFLLDVAYVGSKGTKLLVLGDYNEQPRPGVAKPYPSLQTVEISYDAGFSTYNGLQVKLERRFLDGLYLLNSFTYSHAIDNAAGGLEVGGNDNSHVNVDDLASEKGTSNFNQPINNTTTAVWNVPYGGGRRWGAQAPAVVRGLLGGWGISAINTMASGQPMTLRYSPSGALSVSGLPSYRPNVIGSALMPAATRSPNLYLNIAALQIPTSWPFGDAGRNTLRGYAQYNLNLAAMKDFALGGDTRRRLEFRAEGFNTFNRTNFALPDSNMSDSTFGQITSTQPARVIQFALKLYY